MKSCSASNKQRVRLLKFCASAPFEVVKDAGKKSDKLELKRSGAAVIFGRETFDFLVAEDLLRQLGEHWTITRAGKQHLRRLLAQVDEFSSQHRLLRNVEISDQGRKKTHQSNAAESPLARLRLRICSNGKSYISEANFQAGERLRSDFTRGHMMPRVSSNWDRVINGDIHCGSRNGVSDLSDTAIAARIRTDNALKAAGPEFSGVLVDIVCFLKGLEQVEKERQWPPRSAKLMLNTALSVLARHYGLSKRPVLETSMQHWGNTHYRPKMFVDG